MCRSVAHTTAVCPRINPSATYPEPTSAKSTSYVPRSATVSYTDYEPTSYAADNRQTCFAFNSRKCIRHRCRYLHICSFCGGAHARSVCPVSKAANKKYKNYLSTPVNISRLATGFYFLQITHLARLPLLTPRTITYDRASQQKTCLFHPAAGESHPSRLRAAISSQVTASASRPPSFTFLSLPV